MHHPGGNHARQPTTGSGAQHPPQPHPHPSRLPRARAGLRVGDQAEPPSPLHNPPFLAPAYGAGRGGRGEPRRFLGPPGRNPSVGPALNTFDPPAGQPARRTSRPELGEVARLDGLRVASWNATFCLGRLVLFGVRAPGRAPRPLPPPAGPEGAGGRAIGAEHAPAGLRSPPPPILPQSPGRRCAQTRWHSSTGCGVCKPAQTLSRPTLTADDRPVARARAPGQRGGVRGADAPDPRAPLGALHARPKRPSRATRGPGRSPTRGVKPTGQARGSAHLGQGGGVRGADAPDPRAPLSALHARPKRPSRASRGPGRSPPQGSGTYRPSVVPRAFGWGAGPEERMHPSPMPPSEPAPRPIGPGGAGPGLQRSRVGTD